MVASQLNETLAASVGNNLGDFKGIKLLHYSASEGIGEGIAHAPERHGALSDASFVVFHVG